MDLLVLKDTVYAVVTVTLKDNIVLHKVIFHGCLEFLDVITKVCCSNR